MTLRVADAAAERFPAILAAADAVLAAAGPARRAPSAWREARRRFASIRPSCPAGYRIGMAFCAAIATAVSLGACGSGMPGNAVVQIGQATISTAALDHWLAVANDSTQTQTGAKAPPLPLPPDYTACVKAAEKAAGNTAASRSASQVVGRQADLPDQLRDARHRGARLPDPADVDPGRGRRPRLPRHRQADRQRPTRRRSSPRRPPLATPKELDAFLAASGETVADLKWRTRVNLLGNKIALAVQKKAEKVTTRRSPPTTRRTIAQYTTPETRDIHLVLVSSSLATADKVRVAAGRRSELRDGRGQVLGRRDQQGEGRRDARRHRARS